MKVKDLSAKLALIDPELELAVYNGDCQLQCPVRVEEIDIDDSSYQCFSFDNNRYKQILHFNTIKEKLNQEEKYFGRDKVEDKENWIKHRKEEIRAQLNKNKVCYINFK